MPPIALTNEETAQWSEYLQPLEDVSRQRILVVLRRAGDIVSDFRRQTSREDALAALLDAGMSRMQANMVMTVWDARDGGVHKADEERPFLARTVAEAVANAPAGSTPAEIRGIAEKACIAAAKAAPDVEGRFQFCTDLLNLGPDSSMLGKGKRKSAAEESDDGHFVRNTAEFRKHLKSRAEWMRFVARCKRASISRGYAGLAERFAQMEVFLASHEWAVCARYIPRYVEDHEGRLDTDQDHSILITVKSEMEAEAADSAGAGASGAAAAAAGGISAEAIAKMVAAAVKEATAEVDKRPLCGRCNERGHIRKNCPQPKKE